MELLNFDNIIIKSLANRPEKARHKANSEIAR
jgi:hypothetical protein